MNNDNSSSAVGEAFEYGYLALELAEYSDESVDFIRKAQLPLSDYNEYCREILDWEKAPALPIADWETPGLRPLPAAAFSDAEISDALLEIANYLRRCNQLIRRADHLSDRRLYDLLVKRVLPAPVKRLKRPNGYRYWDFCGCSENNDLSSRPDVESWNELTYYATDAERDDWAERNPGAPLPRKRSLRRRDFSPFNDVDALCAADWAIPDDRLSRGDYSESGGLDSDR